MFDLYLDPNTNDLVIENGDIRTTSSNAELLRQQIALTMNVYTGEWFEDVRYGAINRQLIFRRGVSKSEVDAWFMNIILSFDLVESLIRFESTLDVVTRVYRLDFTVNVVDEGPEDIVVSTAPPSVEIEYPDPINLDNILRECSLPITLEDADRLYEQLHITLPQIYNP